MDLDRYDSLITRLENSARSAPSRYLAAVVGIALLGFLILGLAIGLTALALLGIAALTLAVIASGGKALILFAKLGKLVILLALPAWAMVRAAFTLLFARFPRPAGRELAQAEAPVLFERLAELRAQVGGPRVHVVLLTDELNAAIVQHPRLGIFGWEQNYLILGLPLLHALDEPEALAVVAHEYGHLASCHGRLGGFIYRLRSAWARLQALSEQWNDWGSRLIARLFRWYAPYFNAYTFVLAREHEYAADRFSGEVAGPAAAAQALMRVNVAARLEHDRFWPEIDRQVTDHPDPIADRSRLWARLVRDARAAQTTPAYLEQALQRTTDHHDTHPCLRDRLAALTSEAALPVLPPVRTSAATRWLGDTLPMIEADLDRQWREAVFERWQTRHKRLAECHARLAVLGEPECCTQEEQWERIQLRQEIDPQADVLADTELLLAHYPGHLSARFLCGRLRIEAGDPAGADDLEAVMAADADATLAACEILWRFFRESDPDRASSYRQRWQQRSDFEEGVRRELATLPGDAELAPADLAPEVLAEVVQLIARDGKHVRQAFILRRVLRSDPGIRDYVLAFETRRFTLGDKGATTARSLARGPYPIRVFIVHLGSRAYRGYRRKISRLGIPPVYSS